MDGGKLQEVIKKKEHRYIWLEKELRGSVLECAAVCLVLFLIAGYWVYRGDYQITESAVVFGVAMIYMIWRNFRKYKRYYQSMQQMQDYLEAYEVGNYTYHAEENFMQEGIESQIQEQLERMGFAMAVIKAQMVGEKENTKALITDISHQLKTPLSALKLSFELAEDNHLTTEEKIEFLTRGNKEVKKLELLMEALTNLSRMEADMIQIHPVPQEIRKTLLDAVSSVYMKAFQKQIEIEWEEPELLDMHLKTLHDPKWTQEAFINILDNAVKYSQAGTVIHVHMKEQISYLTIRIEDQGIGIPPNEYSNIFKRFYRVQREEIQKEEGSGVGLYLTRRILEEQGGSVRVEPGNPHGTIFLVILPKITYTL